MWRGRLSLIQALQAFASTAPPFRLQISPLKAAFDLQGLKMFQLHSTLFVWGREKSAAEFCLGLQKPHREARAPMLATAIREHSLGVKTQPYTSVGHPANHLKSS